MVNTMHADGTAQDSFLTASRHYELAGLRPPGYFRRLKPH
jgi:hypothetical protein